MSPRKDEDGVLSATWVRENMVYEPDTGVFLWRKRGFGRTLGKVIGTYVWPGYISIKIEGVKHYAHRVAWLYVHGEWPQGQIDHIDGDKSNNAIANLRVATAAQNSARRRVRGKPQLSPSRGVFPHGVGFVARIHHAGKRHYLGYFPTADAAKTAYEAKAKELYGEFAHEETLTAQDLAVKEAVTRSPHRDWLLVASPGFGG